MRHATVRVWAVLLLVVPTASHLPTAISAFPEAASAAAVTLSVPAEPIPIKAANSIAVVYELHIANVGTQPLRLERIVVRESATADSTPIATYERREIERSVKLIGPRGAAQPNTLSPGVRAVFYVWLTFDSIEKVPRALSHAVTFVGGDTARADTVPVRAPADLVLGPPVGAGDWWIGLGPSNTSEHRRAVIRVGDDPEPHLAQRFGIDWVKMDARGDYARDRKGRTNADWYGYGEPVRAVAAARVVAMIDGIPDNTPGENSRAVPMTVSTVLGNYVVLDLGPASGSLRRYALYGHFKPATVQVHVGDAVNRGQVLGSIGNSGNSDGPHLHFHVTEAPDAATAPLRAEGIPFMLDAFEVVAHDPERVSQRAVLTPLGLHQNALPVEGDVIRIGDRQR